MKVRIVELKSGRYALEAEIEISSYAIGTEKLWKRIDYNFRLNETETFDDKSILIKLIDDYQHDKVVFEAEIDRNVNYKADLLVNKYAARGHLLGSDYSKILETQKESW